MGQSENLNKNLQILIGLGSFVEDIGSLDASKAAWGAINPTRKLFPKATSIFGLTMTIIPFLGWCTTTTSVLKRCDVGGVEINSFLVQMFLDLTHVFQIAWNYQ